MEDLVFELGLAFVLMSGAALIAGRLRISVVPLLIIIGLAVGPHLPHFGLLDLRFIESKPIIDFLGRLGVLFLLFYLGLEFSMGRLVRAGGSILVAGVTYIAINLSLGLLFGWIVGLPGQEILVVAGITTISSSAIVAKVIVDLRRSARPETGLIVGIIMFEDVFLAVYMAMVSGLVLSGYTSVVGVASSVVIVAVFLVGLFAVGRYFARYINIVLRGLTEDAFLFAIFGILFVMAGLSETLGVAEAVAALLIGLVLAETQFGQRIQRIVVPFRDVFGAVFFFSFGLSIDPLALWGAAWMAAAAVAMTIVGNFAAGVIVGRIAGFPTSGGVNIGLTIISRGEFSIVMASLARAGGLLPLIQPFTALYVLTLSILGPIMTKESTSIYEGLSRLMSKVRPGSAGEAVRNVPPEQFPDSASKSERPAVNPEDDND
ncbi:MAG: cation:proton antiporter [Chloroflexi bacterium]|nr:cation:proton antiporter [Chloroflexota bacterium]